MTVNKHKIKIFFIAFAWLAAACGCITLLASGVHHKELKRCRGVEIEISGVSNTFFIDRNDVYRIIKHFGGDSTQHKPLQSVDLKRIESELEKDVWVKNAELFFDNNNMLKVSVEEREPVARVFTLAGSTFYIDSSCKMLPLSDKFSARLPVFTSFLSDAKVLSKRDSSLLRDIKNISLSIAADSFLTALIGQVDIKPDRTFEMIPSIGKQMIVFGDALDAAAKFSRLKLFYKEVIAQTGWNRYRIINLSFRDQVVGVIRGKEDIVADSLKTLAMIKFIADDAARRAADSTQSIVQDSDKNSVDNSMINQSIQREDDGEPASSIPDATPPVRSVPPPVLQRPPAGTARPKPAAVPKPKKPAAPPKPKPGGKPENEY